MQATSYDVEVRIPALDQQQIQLLCSMWQQCSGNMKIEVIRNASFWQRIRQHTSDTTQNFSVRTLSWSTTKFLFNGSVFSYLTVFYFIYRVYNLVNKLNNFIQWWNSSSSETALIQDVERMFLRTVKIKKEQNNPANIRSLSVLSKKFQASCTENKMLLSTYLIINEFLESSHIRWLFPYNTDLKRESIQITMALLTTLEEKSYQSESRFILPNDEDSGTLSYISKQ